MSRRAKSGDNVKIFDYLGAARPIVATDVTAHGAVLQDEEALLVEPTPEALEQGILRLVQDDQLARRMVGASAARRERVGWPAFLADLDQIYGSLGGRSR